jgi:polyisoprenoid-binding protein YceI
VIAALWLAGLAVTLDPLATRVTFTLGATMHTVHGTARTTRGSIAFDPDSGIASGEVVIDSRSAATDNEGRDKKMHEEVLESAKFPEIVFRPQRVEGRFVPDGASDLKIIGRMEIHGGAHEVALAARVQASGGRISGTAQLEVPYVDWGMKDPSVFVLRVKKTVTIQLEFAGSVGPS